MMAPISSNKTFTTTPSHLLMTYGVFIMSAGAVWHFVADGAFSSILTMAVMVQCLGVALLALQMVSTGSASGISARALSLDALAICCKLSSTLWLNGYLPVDASGDHVFQLFDICSLAIFAWTLYQILVVNRHSYQAEEDSLPILPMTLGAFVLACLLHGNMNGRVIFDTLWMTGLFVSTIAVLPQLWLITKTGGCIEALTSHYIAAMAVSRAMSGIFMWHAHADITCVSWIGNFNHTGWAILAAHLLQMLLLGDFGYYYVKAVLKSGLNCVINTVEDCGV
jgi:uncharacterized protein with PQ loop repeat